MRSTARVARRRQGRAHDMSRSDVGQFKVYNLQRQFLAFLENAGLREERVPGGRGEVVFYNLGKFSQAISDFESIHFHSKPGEKYASVRGLPAVPRRERLPGGLAGQRSSPTPTPCGS